MNHSEVMRILNDVLIDVDVMHINVEPELIEVTQAKDGALWRAYESTGRLTITIDATRRKKAQVNDRW